MLYKNLINGSLVFVLEEDLRSYDGLDVNHYVLIKEGNQKLIIEEQMFNNLYARVENPKDLL